MDFSYPEIKKLYEQTYEVFSNIPEVAKIAIYGSVINKNYDRYSDLDIEVQLSDWDPLSSKIESIIKNIGNPYIIFPAVNDPGNVVLTVLWRDYPFYQKLDMRLLPLNTSLSSESQIVYENKYKKNKEKAKKAFKLSFDEAYRPFYDLFIGATRYVKHRKRGEYLSAYKFYRSGWEDLIKLYFYYIPQGKYSNSSITIEELKQIDRKDKSIAKILEKYISANPHNINDYYVNLLERYISDSKLNSLIQKSSLEEDFGQNVIQFVRNELLRA